MLITITVVTDNVDNVITVSINYYSDYHHYCINYYNIIYNYYITKPTL